MHSNCIITRVDNCTRECDSTSVTAGWVATVLSRCGLRYSSLGGSRCRNTWSDRCVGRNGEREARGNSEHHPSNGNHSRSHLGLCCSDRSNHEGENRELMGGLISRSTDTRQQHTQQCGEQPLSAPIPSHLSAVRLDT